MSAGGILLLIADVVGVAVAVILTARDRPADATPADVAAVRGVRLAEAGLVGVLVALIAFQADVLGLLGVLGLVACALTAGEALRFTMAISHLESRGFGRGGSALTGLALLVLLFTAIPLVFVGIAASSPRPVPTPTPNADGQRYGVIDLLQQTTPVETRTLPASPALADADVAGGMADAIYAYGMDGGRLTIVALIHCGYSQAAVLLGPDAEPGVVDVVDVIVPNTGYPLYRPTASPPRLSGCVDPEPRLVAAEVTVDLPPALHAESLRDVGTGATPRHVR